MNIKSDSIESTKRIGERIGSLLSGGEIIELIGDVGAGKTSLVKGIAIGLGVDEGIQSPSFTISRTYDARDEIKLVHYDFYRLASAGIMLNELQDSMSDPKNVIIIEWSEIVQDLLPSDRLKIEIVATDENSRILNCTADGNVSNRIIERLSK